MTDAIRSKRPIFAPARPHGRFRKRVTSFLISTTVIAFSTWGGVLLAQELGGTGRMNNGVTRWINHWVGRLSDIDPTLAAVLAAFTGLVCIAFFVRDHN